MELLFDDAAVEVLSLREGVVLIRAKPGALIGLDDARSHVGRWRAYVETHPAFADTFAMLVDMTELREISLPARRFYGQLGGVSIRATALVSRSAVGRVIANFLIGLSRPRNERPTRMFGDAEEALAWLESFRPGGARIR